MIPSFVNRTTSASGADQSAYVTASISPSASTVLFAGIAQERATVATAIQPTLSGGGVSTWTFIGTLPANTDQRVSIFRASTGSSPTSGAVTIDFASEAQNSCAWSIIEVTDALLTGTNAEDAVAQVGSGSALSGSSLSVTLPSPLGDDDNRLLCFGFNKGSGRTVTWTTGYDTISGAVASASGISLIGGTGRNGTSQVISGTWVPSGEHVEIAIEVVGASDPTPEAPRSYPRITRKRLPGGLL